MSAECEVGYGKPPKAGQFKKGQSGNPKGRSKGSLNLTTVIRQEMCRTVRIRENGAVRVMTKAQAVIATLTARAMGGDSKAAKALLELLAQHLPSMLPCAAEHEHTPVTPFAWTKEDATLAPFLEEIANGKPTDVED